MAYEHRDNEGTLWPQDKSGPAGDGKFVGRDVFLMLGRTGAKSDAAPTHRLILIFKDDGSALAVAMFKPKKEIENLIINGSTADHFVSVWKNTAKDDPSKTYFRVTFKNKDGAAAGSPSTPADGDDCPF